MPFGSYRTLGEALRTLQITAMTEEYFQPLPLAVRDAFQAELAERLEDCPVSCSEWAVCENLIYPVLSEAAKGYRKELVIWSHLPLYQGEELLGVPDYLIAKRSPLSVEVLDRPFALFMEAKRNDFDAGWAQCLAAMHGIQSLNGDPQRVVYGGVSDGFIWRFGKLRDRSFSRHPQDYSLTRLEELFTALHGVLELCKQQVLSPAEAA